MPAIDLTRVAQAVRSAREKAGWTQARLAEAAGVSDETVSRVERGAYEPALGTMAALASALGTTIDRLAGRDAEVEVRRAYAPLVQRIVATAEKLAPEAQAALLRVAEMMPKYEPSRKATGPGRRKSK